MTTDQIQLVQQSWKQVLPIAETAGTLFYNRLFEIAPEVRPLFGDDLKPQIAKLMGMLGMVVTNLTQLGTLVPKVEELGRRHGKYGVEPAHFDKVGEALLWTLEKGLGDAWQPDVATAWTTAYTTLANVMIEAMEVVEA
ncbi:MAG: globin family protein [Bacteroidota bacterium]